MRNKCCANTLSSLLSDRLIEEEAEIYQLADKESADSFISLAHLVSDYKVTAGFT